VRILTKNEDLCTACHNCEFSCSNLYFKEKNVSKASIRIRLNEHGISSINSCTQCGEFADVCPVQAIYRDKSGIFRIKKKICVGCLMCVARCKENAMFQQNSMIEPFKCVSCGICTQNCPTQAITIKEI